MVKKRFRWLTVRERALQWHQDLSVPVGEQVVPFSEMCKAQGETNVKAMDVDTWSLDFEIYHLYGI